MDVVQAHKALADPGRVELARGLLARDLSPGEIADHYGWSTPLVAHHVKVLVEAGLVVRTRSEHDSRRAYVGLRHDDPDVVAMVSIGLPAGDQPRRVAFVCTHNSARSKLAAAWWRRCSDVPAIDAGTAPAARPARGALAVAEREGLDIDPATRRADEVLAPGDLVVAVCDHVHETLPANAERLHWSVPDPVAAARPHAFDEASSEIRRRVTQLHRLKGNPHGHHRPL
ncbi:MarR family transcriptional regulator [Propionibacteriaceae bacterium Y1923]